ncbi:MAG TPA: hypothetical protein VGO93_07165 [Candidatus Xenobia bacterium]
MGRALGVLAVASGLLAGCVRAPSPTPINVLYTLHGDALSPAIGLVFQHTNVLSRYSLAGQVSGADVGRPLSQAVADGPPDVILTGGDTAILMLARGFRGKLLGSAGAAGRVGVAAAVPPKRIETVPDTALDGLLTAWQTEGMVPTAAHEPVDADHLLASARRGEAVMAADPDLQDIASPVLHEARQPQAVMAAEVFLQRDREGAERLMAAATDAVYFIATHRAMVDGWLAHDLGAVLPTNHDIRAHSIVDVQMELTPDIRADLQATADELHADHVTSNPLHLQEFIDDDPVLRSHARFKGYYDPNAVQVVH